MKLFGIGVLWSIYAMSMFIGSQLWIDNHPGTVISIGPSSRHPGLHAWQNASAIYRERVAMKCAAWTIKETIYDSRKNGATYMSQCSSLPRAILLNVIAVFLIFAPVALLAVGLRKKST